MKTLKKALALILSTMMLLSMMTVMSSAAAPSVTKQSIAGAVVTVAPATFNNSAQSPSVTVTVNGVTLQQGVDFTLQVQGDCVNAGSYTVTVNGINLYGGTATGVFTINPKSLSGAKVTLKKSSVKYTGKNLGSKIGVSSVVVDGITLSEGDYSVTPPKKTVKASGKYAVTVTGNGNFTGSAKAVFTVAASETKTPTLTVSAKKSSLKYSYIKKHDYRLKVTHKVTPKGDKGVVTLSVKAPKGGAKYVVTSAKKGVVRFKKGAPKGTYKVTVKIGAYNSCKEATETITITVK